MIFSSFEFAVLLAVVLAGLGLTRDENQRRNLLLVASYVFYGWWDWRFCFLILTSTIIDFVAGQKIEGATERRTRVFWLVVSLVANLGFLGFFKCANFLAETLEKATGRDFDTLAIILPVGISFFTFQSMSYRIDVYRGRLAATRSFRDFALFVSFFPQLVAGTEVFIKGFVKKLLFADTLAVYVDPIFEDPAAWDSETVW